MGNQQGKQVDFTGQGSFVPSINSSHNQKGKGIERDNVPVLCVSYPFHSQKKKKKKNLSGLYVMYSAKIYSSIQLIYINFVSCVSSGKVPSERFV